MGEVYGSRIVPVQVLIPNNTQDLVLGAECQNLRHTAAMCGGRCAIATCKPKDTNDTMIVITGTELEISSVACYLIRCMEPKSHNQTIEGEWTGEVCIVLPASFKKALPSDGQVP